ncbi:hypothetical protein GEMRC1_006893 [Eukaryota sp. GEM-RC1]
MNNVKQINGRLAFSVGLNGVCKDLTYEQLIRPLVEHIVLELNHSLSLQYKISSLVLPHRLPLQHQHVLLDTFHKLGYPDITVVSTWEALVASYLFKAPEPSQLETVVIVDVGHLLTKAVVFLHQRSDINVIHSEEWWMGADQVDQALYEYCLSKIDPHVIEQMSEKSKMKLLLACSEAKTKSTINVFVEELIPNHEFAENVPISVLDSFLSKLDVEMYTFQQDFRNKLDGIDFKTCNSVTKVVPVGRLAALHSVRAVMETVFNVRLTCILDPIADVALGGLRFRDQLKNYDHRLPKNFHNVNRVQPYGQKVHHEFNEKHQHPFSFKDVDEVGTHSEPLLIEPGVIDPQYNKYDSVPTTQNPSTNQKTFISQNVVPGEVRFKVEPKKKSKDLQVTSTM